MATDAQVWTIWDLLGGGFAGDERGKETIKKLHELDTSDAWELVAKYKEFLKVYGEAKAKLAKHGIQPHGTPWLWGKG